MNRWTAASGALALAVGLAACDASSDAASDAERPVQDTVMSAAADTGAARATLRDSAGREVGTATFTAADGGVRIQVNATGLSEGEHGLHIHETGRCEPPAFESAGGHFNPDGREHGSQSPGGPHAGDLPNLRAGADGSATIDTTTALVTLASGERSLLRSGGTAIVIHSGADDYRSQPSGDAGTPVACGVIERQ